MSFLFYILIISFNIPKQANGYRFCANNDTNLQLINNGYQTLKIRIAESVAENYDLVVKLKELFVEFSKTLFLVTRKRAYLRDVTIILPRSWGAGPPEIENRINAESADGQLTPQIWIKNTSPRDNIPQNRWQPRDPIAFIVPPYTIKATPCGYPGKYIRLSPEMVLFGNETEVRELLGDPDKLLAKEWAKLRWGVYDEIPRDVTRDSYYRLSNRDIVATTCSAAIQGVNINISHPEQECDLEEALTLGGCRFEPDPEQRNITYSSLLYRANLPFIDGYCDESAPNVAESHTHANSAPTAHNLHCKGQSIWGVMRKHPDFLGGKNPSIDIPQPPPINFHFSKILNEKIVLVLDVSSSMRSFGRIKLMQQAVGYFIDTVPLSTWIGIVCFARQVTRDRELMQVTSDGVREWLKEQSYCNIDMGTSIGSGILAASRILLSSGPRNSRGKGGKMIILTDGVEHFRPKINETFATVKRIGVTITTIAFGGKVEKDLESLAFQTNGRAFAVSSGEYGIDSELQEVFQSQQDTGGDGPQTVLSEEIRIAVNSSKKAEFFIDPSIGKNTLITIFYKQRINAFVSLVSPEAEVFNRSSIDVIKYTVDDILNITYIRISGVAQSGKWVIHLRNPFQTKPLVLRISVASRETEREALVVSPALLCRSVDVQGQEVMVIYVYLSLGELAVLNATVGAIITRPLTQSAQLVDTASLVLIDNGLDPDITANDGVYSAYFVDFTASGRYMVKVYARNDNGRAYIDEDYLLGIGRHIFSVVSFSTRNITAKSNRKKRSTRRLNRSLKQYLPEFNRVASSGGAFLVEDFPDNNVLCPKGYKHFQKNCYKVFASPLGSYRDSRQICQVDGGNLAVVKSHQAFTWLMKLMGFKKDQLSKMKTWFGGLSKPVQDLLINRVSSLPVDDLPDHDLNQMVSAIARNYSKDIIEKFEPNLEGMSNKDINRLLASLGLESVEELENIQEVLFKSSLSHFNFRRKRQVAFPEDDATISEFAEDTTIALSPVNQTGLSTSAHDVPDNSFYDVTLSEAKRQPKNLEPDGSGAEIPTCKWFQNGRIIASSGEVCNTKGRFLCEKKVSDRYPPSRVIDLKVEFSQENQSLKLTWSAPGNDLAEGQADQYEIRTLATDQALTLLENNFARGQAILIDRLPAVAGRTEVAIVNISKHLECPQQAILDLILALPSNVVSPEMPTVKESTIKFINQVLSSFILDEFNIQVSAFATTTPYTPIFNFTNQLNSGEVVEKLQSVGGSIASKNRTVNEVISFLIKNGGRKNIPKVLLAITEENPENFAQIRNINVSIIIGVGNKIERYQLWDLASKPGCDNSFLLDDLTELPAVSSDVIKQLCRARRNELHAVSLRAIDEAGNEGEPSNVESFYVRHSPVITKCQKPTPSPLPVQAGGMDAATIGLSIGIPLLIILIIMGLVMIFGQIKKQRKKRKEKKEKEVEEEKLQKRLEERRKRKETNMSNNNNNNNKRRFCLNLFSCRNSSSVSPIV